MILQSNSYDPNTSKDMKSIHIINFSAVRESQERDFIRLGRSVHTDLRVNDISVSRIHAHIRMDRVTKKVFVEDNESKFGTLIQIQRPMFLKENKAYYLQSGRSIIKA
jgi:predicted N-acetyltransferase YhbS